MKQFFKELFEYNHHSNQKLAEVFVNHSDRMPEKPLQLISHIFNAHQVWNNRIDKKQSLFGVWELHAVHDLKQIDKENFEHSLHILEHFNLDETLSYTNSSGQSFNNSIRDILFHVINHSNYHRAQIATSFRQCGLEALSTDYIFYKRS